MAVRTWTEPWTSGTADYHSAIYEDRAEVSSPLPSALASAPGTSDAAGHSGAYDREAGDAGT